MGATGVIEPSSFIEARRFRDEGVVRHPLAQRITQTHSVTVAFKTIVFVCKPRFRGARTAERQWSEGQQR
jgi:hypothetical protein